MSCSSDDSEKVIIQEIPRNSIDPQIDGNTSQDYIIKVSAFYNCEENLSVNDTSEIIALTSHSKIKEFGVSICNVFKGFIEFNNEINFLDVVRKSQAVNQNLTVSSESTSLNGDSIQFKNYNQFIKDMPLGVYNFESLSNTGKIEQKNTLVHLNTSRLIQVYLMIGKLMFAMEVLQSLRTQLEMGVL